MIESVEDFQIHPSLAIGQDGTIHIAYLREIGNGEATVATRGPDDRVWTLGSVDTLIGLDLGFYTTWNPVSLALDETRRPWIAYSDRSGVRIAHHDGSGWQIEIVSDSPQTGEAFGQTVSLAIDSDNGLHLAWNEIVGSGQFFGTIMYGLGTP